MATPGGYRVGIIARRTANRGADITLLGNSPFWGVTGGCIDSWS
jgi:hypothetical protein